MKTSLKYGLLITLGAVVWVLIAHYTVANPASMVHKLGTPLVFNVLQFTMIYLGIKSVEREKGDRLAFKEGIKTGFGISVVYGLTISIFFAIALAVIGTKWMEVEPGGAGIAPRSQIAGAFFGLFLSVLVFGLIYSTVISFFIAKRATDENGSH